MTDKTEKMYTIAGVSTLGDVVTFRFATGRAKVRAGVLKRNGHTDIDLRDLPREMTKADAQAFLEAQGINAVVPVSGRKAAVVQTPEEIEAAKKAAEVAAKNEERRAARAAKKAAEVAKKDDDFLAGITGEEGEVVADGSAESLIEEGETVQGEEGEVVADGSAESLIEAPANVELVDQVMIETDELTAESILASLDKAGI